MAIKKVGDTIKCINTKALSKTGEKPELELNKEYPLNATHVTKNGEVHYDVGLQSKLAYVSDYKSGESLPNSSYGGIHWCHSSRFE